MFTELFVIDPQNDFCDLPAQPGRVPALPVAGAAADMQRLAAWLDAQGAAVSGVTLTLDSHPHIAIERPAFWVQENGAEVAPFTPITSQDVRARRYLPRNEALVEATLGYLQALESRGKYTLMVWPAHCEIGSWGHNVHAELSAAVQRWEERAGRNGSKVLKGQNPLTESYSALCAEVPDSADPSTHMNAKLGQRLAAADRIVIAGEASSHCVRATTQDLVQVFLGGRADKIVLLGDCMSPVTGFETQAQAFLAGMQSVGAQVRTTENFRLDL